MKGTSNLKGSWIYFNEDGTMKTLAELRAMCREQGISIDGPKEELVRRMLYSKEITDETDDCSTKTTLYQAHWLVVRPMPSSS